MAADSDALRRYKPSEYAAMEKYPARALMIELQRVSEALDVVVAVVKKLDARMVAHGF